MQDLRTCNAKLFECPNKFSASSNLIFANYSTAKYCISKAVCRTLWAKGIGYKDLCVFANVSGSTQVSK